MTENDGHNDDLNDDDGVGWTFYLTLPSLERKCNLHGEAPVTNAVTARRK